MKNFLIKTIALTTITLGAWSCGEDFFNTEYYEGVYVDTGLSTVESIEIALNGTYSHILDYGFTGNYAINIGDVPTDIAYHNGETGWMDDIYQFNYQASSLYFESVWEYGYKIIDNASRIIKASNEMYADANEDQKARLDQVLAEAYALRGFAQLILVNVFCHQVKVNGTDFSSEPGLVIVKDPIPAFTEVNRNTIGKTYEALLSDLTTSLEHFAVDGVVESRNIVYVSEAAVHGLIARANLYLENWEAAIASAQKALDVSGITALAYTDEAYLALYYNETSNVESMFAVGIDSQNSWGGNSAGTIWNTYSYSPSQKLQAMYGENDCRKSIFIWTPESTPTVPEFFGGKFHHFQTGDPSRGTSYLVNAPEMFLIIAEANARKATPNVSAAAEALLTVAKRNADIQTTDDLPSNAVGLVAFIKDERARELFQEGLRLYDLRRWDEMVGVYAYGAPETKYMYSDYKISELVFPIPSTEINSGFGVKQNENWEALRPR